MKELDHRQWILFYPLFFLNRTALQNIFRKWLIFIWIPQHCQNQFDNKIQVTVVLDSIVTIKETKYNFQSTIPYSSNWNYQVSDIYQWRHSCQI